MHPCTIRLSHLIGSSSYASAVNDSGNSPTARNRPRYIPAERPCMSCGNTYRGNSRAKAQLCPNCRTLCITCKKEKSPSDITHAECHQCRVATNTKKLCITCVTRRRTGTRSTCQQCYEVSNPQRNSRFGLKPGQYEAMLEAQNGLCTICHCPEKQLNPETSEPLALSIDHDRTCCPGSRSCGKCIRELVCRNCNAGIGLLGDDPTLLRAAADYIERHRT